MNTNFLVYNLEDNTENLDALIGDNILPGISSDTNIVSPNINSMALEGNCSTDISGSSSIVLVNNSDNISDNVGDSFVDFSQQNCESSRPIAEKLLSLAKRLKN